MTAAAWLKRLVEDWTERAKPTTQYQEGVNDGLARAARDLEAALADSGEVEVARGMLTANGEISVGGGNQAKPSTPSRPHRPRWPQMTAPTTREGVLRELNYYFKAFHGWPGRESSPPQRPGYERDCVSMVWGWLEQLSGGEGGEVVATGIVRIGGADGGGWIDRGNDDGPTFYELKRMVIERMEAFDGEHVQVVIRPVRKAAL